MRIAGDLRPMPNTSLSGIECTAMIREALGPEATSDLAGTDEIDACHAIGALGRFRIRASRGHVGPAAVFRAIPETVPPLERLGLPRSVASFAGLRRGLVILAGPTGSGKTTTLASIVDAINRSRRVSVVTIEKPVEHVHASRASMVIQREVGRHAASFAAGVAAALRDGPEVIVIGDVSSPDTIRAAMEAASRGHLVLTAMCASSAIDAIERVLESCAPSELPRARCQLALHLQGVIAQTLVKRKDDKGRCPAVEALLNLANMPTLIRDGKLQQAYATLQSSGRVGMSTLNDSLVRLVSEGQVDSREALAASMDRDALLKGLLAAGVEIGERALQA